MQRDSTDAYISSGRPRREEILLRPRGDRWLFLEQRTASLGISLRDCVTRTSDANLARSLHRKKKRCADEVEETENDRERERRGETAQEGCVFAAFLGLSTKSHPRLDFGFVSKSRDVASLFVSTFRSSLPRFIADSRYIDDPVSHLLFPSPRNLFVLSIYHRHCQARGSSLHTVDFIRSFCAAPRRYRDSVAYYNEDL